MVIVLVKNDGGGVTDVIDVVSPWVWCEFPFKMMDFVF